jgi:hypothetical protein
MNFRSEEVIKNVKPTRKAQKIVDNFLRLHTECVTALEIYTAEADILCRMLAACNGDATVSEQVALIAQRRQEDAAHAEYVRARKRLLRAARHD